MKISLAWVLAGVLVWSYASQGGIWCPFGDGSVLIDGKLSQPTSNAIFEEINGLVDDYPTACEHGLPEGEWSGEVQRLMTKVSAPLPTQEENGNQA